MKNLYEFAENFLNDDQANNSISGNDLSGFKELLLTLDEFKNVEDIIISDTIDHKITDLESIRINENTSFSGKCYLYSISLTPKIYNPNTLLTTVKDGCSLSPVWYDPTNLIPYRFIMISYCPEILQDNRLNNEEILIKSLHDKLDNIINNPSDYMIKGKREIIVRGIFNVNN